MIQYQLYLKEHTLKFKFICGLWAMSCEYFRFSFPQLKLYSVSYVCYALLGRGPKIIHAFFQMANETNDADGIQSEVLPGVSQKYQ